MTDGRKNRKIVKAMLVFTLVLFTLASGHLLMVIINNSDYKISSKTYERKGIEGRWFGDFSIKEEIQNNLKTAKLKNKRKEIDFYRAILEKINEGEEIKFNLLPVSNFIIYAMFGLILLGFFFLYISKYSESDGVQSLFGLFAGLFLWTGVEYSLLIAARILGIAKKLTFFNGKLVGEYGEYLLLKYSWGFLIVVISYLLFLEVSRCNLFAFFRRHLNLMKKRISTGRIDNYAPHTAFLFTTVTWFFYVLLLLAYDNTIFGVYSWFTYLVFFLSFFFTGYLFVRLTNQTGFGSSLRYAIPTAMVFWNDIEILAKWRIFQEPWLIFSPITAVIFFGGLIFGIYLVLKEIKKSSDKKQVINAN